MHIYMYTCISMCIQIYTSIDIYVFMNTRTQTHTHTHTHTRTQIYMNITVGGVGSAAMGSSRRWHRKTNAPRL